ncbi:hypothetical protein [Nocardia sp. NPDC003345]
MSGEETNSPLGIFGPVLGIDPAAVQSRLAGQQSQSGAEHFGDQVSHGGKDPSYITEMEQFEGFSHAEIHTNVEAMTPGIMHALADRYEELANALGGALFGTNLAIQRELSDGLHGQFADSAVRAARQFYDQATDVQEVFRSVGFRIKAAAYGAEVVKKSVPPPPTALPPANPVAVVGPAQVAQTVVGAMDPASAAALDRYKEDQRLVAVEVMNMAYKPTYQPAGDGVPSFIPVQAPGDGDSPGTTNPNGSSPGNPGGTTTSTSPGGVTPGGETPGGENPGEDSAPGTPGTEEESQTTTAGTEDNPTTQQPAGTTTGNPTGDPQRTTPSTTTTGSPSVVAGSPSGAPRGPGGTPQSQTPGKTVTSTPGAQNVSSGGPAAASTAGTSRAMSGMPGMMAPGAAGRRGEDDAEHATPDYLIHDREEELFGAPITAVNGVLGGDAPAAQPADDRYERGDRR